MTPEQLKAEREALARECGATFYKNRHSPHEPAVAFSPTAWEKFTAAQAQRADVQGEVVAWQIRRGDTWLICTEHEFNDPEYGEESRALVPASAVASLTARVAELEALCKQAEEALHTAHDHIEMHRLDVSHIKDANLIRATLASLREV